MSNNKSISPCNYRDIRENSDLASDMAILAFNQAGVLHNQVLKSLMGPSASVDMSVEDNFFLVRKTVQGFYPFISLDSIIDLKYFSKINQKLIQLEQKEKVLEFPYYPIAEGLINHQQKELLELVHRLLYSMLDSKDINELVSTLASMERLICCADLTFSEKLPIFAATAIARHSSSYWMDKPTDVNSTIRMPKWLDKALRVLSKHNWTGGAPG